MVLVSHFGLVQKIEEPVRTNFPANTDSGAQNFGPKQSEADEFFKSKSVNRDTEVFGTEVGIADAMRFKGAGKFKSFARFAWPRHVVLMLTVS